MRLGVFFLATAFVGFALPAVADQPTECDRLAASPDDPGRAAPAVQLADIDGAAAEATCRDEIEKAPTAGRFIFQLARALEAEEKTDEARDTNQAAVDAGYTRIRPVLMTAAAMIVGMLPMAIGGAGEEQNAALARAVIGGLLFATPTTLLVVPYLFAMLRMRNDGKTAHGVFAEAIE